MLLLSMHTGTYVYFFTKRANCGLPCYIKKKGKYRNEDENIDEFQEV